MQGWPVPTTLKQLRGFLGLTGYYRRFIKGYGVISRPLTNLLKKGMFHQDDSAEKAFNQLKIAMSIAPILSLPDYNIPFTIEAGVSDQGIGAVLMQQGKPLIYLSKGLSLKHQDLSTYEKELLAIVMATQKWHTYLQGNHLIIKTDHQSLKYLLEQRLSTLLQQKWLAKLMGLDYTIEYKKGKKNIVADALSRVPSRAHKSDLMELPAVKQGWLSDIYDIYVDDDQVKLILEGIATKNEAYDKFKYSCGLLKLDGRIYIGISSYLKQSILWEFHDSSMGGHSGQEATYKRLPQFFYWPRMQQDVTAYVSSCDTCQRIKIDNTFPGGLLQPFPIPNQVWEDISLDFIEGLPKSNDKNCILVVVDCFTKVGQFIPLSHLYSATTVAQLFLDDVYKLQGLSKTITSDRDKIFTSQFWQTLFKLVGTKLQLSTSYHPQTDGQMERLNWCIEQ